MAADARPSGVGAFVWDFERDVITASPAWAELHGLGGEPTEISLGLFLEVVHSEDRRRLMRHRRTRPDEAREVDYRVRLAGGEWRWLRWHAEVSAEADDGTPELRGYVRDVTEERAREHERLRVQRELTHQQRVLEHLARGEPLERILAAICRMLERRYPGAQASIDLAGEEPAGAGGDAVGLTGATRYPLRGVDGERLGTLAVLRPASADPGGAEQRDMLATARLAALAVEHHRTQARLRSAARLDPLTELPNRAGFLERVEAALAVPDGEARQVAVLFVDLDRFGQVNDSLGHTTGDCILKEAAQRIAEGLGHSGVLARYGGDDFTVLLTGLDAERAEAVADGILAALRDPIRLRGGEFFLSASVGIARGEDHVDAPGLVADADAAMYAARASGLGTYARFDASLRREVLGRLALETLLRRSIAHGDFHMLFQPIVDLRTGGWSGVEALVRWRHPERGITGPDAFIPLAEETGLIVPLGELIIDMAIRDAAALFRSLPERPDLYVTVNVSAIQLADPALTQRIETAIRTYGLPPDQLVVEVTESAVMQEPEQAGSILRALTELGVRVLIDDFGTGYSSIARLGDLPGAGVKIDQRFARDLGRDARAARVLGAIASLAHAHEHLVIVEGIESALALGTVAELGCEYGQGFHLAAPAREADVLAILRGAPPLAQIG